MLTSWTWILVVLYTSCVVLADVIIFIACLGKMLLQRPPWFQDGQCSNKTVSVEDGGWWKESLPSTTSDGEDSDGCTEEKAGNLETKWLFTLTNYAIWDFISLKLAFLQKRGNLLSIGFCVEQMSKFVQGLALSVWYPITWYRQMPFGYFEGSWTHSWCYFNIFLLSICHNVLVSCDILGNSSFKAWRLKSSDCKVTTRFQWLADEALGLEVRRRLSQEGRMAIKKAS